jgi:hypothetical protein
MTSLSRWGRAWLYLLIFATRALLTIEQEVKVVEREVDESERFDFDNVRVKNPEESERDAFIPYESNLPVVRPGRLFEIVIHVRKEPTTR